MLLAALVAGAFVAVASSGALSSERVRGWVDGYGIAGPIVFVVVSSLLTVCLFPGPLLSGASGLLFGTALGTGVSIVSATLGAVLAFSLARWLAHDAVEELQGRRLAALRAWVGRRGFLSVLYARLAPGIPYNLVNYAAGLSPVTLGAFAGATALGCAPRAFAYTALGGSLDDLGSPEAIAAFVVLILMALAGLLLARRDLRNQHKGV
ncbi:MAG TPA: TVP38/TMEM64 family protein [Baekduia sp.]|nr:TVP38/TMEM64 family protein [Baekduia sp.]